MDCGDGMDSPFAALVLLLVCKKLIPKFPMAVLLMIAGAGMTYLLPIEDWGVQTLASVDTGLPHWAVPDFSVISIREAVTISLSVAVVIMAETLLAENNFAQKNGYRINDNQEILAFSMGNFLAAFTGCCPINGSVSRTAMGEQYQAKTQLTGIIAGLSMIVVLVCATGFIGYLPVPVLTAIVISALLGATEFDLAARLFNVSRTECLIFFGAFFGVLLLGTINGVLIGILLSFTEMIIRTAKPARCFLGIQPGHKHFRDLKESSQIHAISGVLIYRFSSNLFFANIQILQRDIEDHITPETKAVIIDASGIGSIDITAADRIAMLYQSLKDKGIRFYMTEHIADVNEQLRKLGLGYLTIGEETPSLSGGEAQRLKLASEIGKIQSDSVFVFDEPSIGLHPLDVQVLLKVFQALLDNGATVIVIEHDLDVIRNADYVIDMGPGGGENGGKIIARGTPQEIKLNKKSITGRYL